MKLTKNICFFFFFFSGISTPPEVIKTGPRSSALISKSIFLLSNENDDRVASRFEFGQSFLFAKGYKPSNCGFCFFFSMGG